MKLKTEWANPFPITTLVHGPSNILHSINYTESFILYLRARITTELNYENETDKGQAGYPHK
jgi:hypothetical protein